ncbi:MAG: hypothetical protein RH860_06350 [Cytophagales bacterium]
MKDRFLLIIFTAFIITTSSLAQSSVGEFFAKGKSALDQSDYITAIAEFTHVLSIDPENGEAYFLRATAKDELAKQIGFSDTELCHDLVNALNYGRLEAMDLLEENCMGFCFTMKNAFFTPENVFCADLSSSVLTELPHNLEELTQLVKLNLYNNKIVSLSDDIASLGELVDLDLSSNKLTSINPKIKEVEYLHWLNLNKNELRDLPSEFGELKNLKALYLRNNYFESVPVSITRLNNLKILDLSVNQLTSLPIEIANLKNLDELILVGNKIPPSEQKKIQALLPNTKIYFDKEN